MFAFMGQIKAVKKSSILSGHALQSRQQIKFLSKEKLSLVKETNFLLVLVSVFCKTRLIFFRLFEYLYQLLLLCFYSNGNVKSA
eukprot:m.171304 g.171304  ORF g.171304 m.171304 type:complete len:84 (+) comp39053_c1_seq10:3475-3726(+)